MLGENEFRLRRGFGPKAKTLERRKSAADPKGRFLWIP